MEAEEADEDGTDKKSRLKESRDGVGHPSWNEKREERRRNEMVSRADLFHLGLNREGCVLLTRPRSPLSNGYRDDEGDRAWHLDSEREQRGSSDARG